MRSCALCAFVLLVSSSVYAQLYSWDNQLFDFGWTPYNPTIDRCSNIQVGWNERSTASPHMQPPYSLIALYGGVLPITIATVQSTAYNWTVTLPAGGPYITTMKDGQGYTGGDSLVFNVLDSTNGTCGTTTTTANTLQVSSTGSLAECSAIVVNAQGGSAPYTMQIYVGERPPKTTTWTTSTMSYTIDIKPSEQFFVMVTDANGNVAVDGIHTVTAGDTTCYNVATTVIAGSLPTTLTYNPSITGSFPQSQSSSSQTHGSSSQSTTLLVQNTNTATVTSVVTLPDGSKSTYTLPPGASVTVVAAAASSPPSSSTNLPAIIGGAAGGAALIVLILIIYFMQRRMAAQKKRLREQQEAYERRRLSEGPLPRAATHIQPFMHGPNRSPNRDSAPLMRSNYSSGIPSVVTPAPSGESYFGNVPGNVTWGNSEASYYQPNPYSPISVVSPHSTGPPMSNTSVPSGVTEGIPPGAMPPVIGSSTGPMRQVSVSLSEKATFVPVRPSAAAPPPYSNS